MHEFNRSIQYTRKLYKVDIRQSVAYSKALNMAGILTDEETVEMERGLKIVEKEWDEGTVSERGRVKFAERPDLSSISNLTMKTSLPQTKDDCLRLLGQASEVKSIPAGAGTIRPQQTLGFGS